jgi:hypothetical protein
MRHLARTDITISSLMIARLMVTMGRIGSKAKHLSEQGHGFMGLVGSMGM